MKTIFAYDPWRLVENELHKDDMRLSESMTSIGNGHMGMRGNFEERYSGDSHRGTYLAGVWFPDKTRAAPPATASTTSRATLPVCTPPSCPTRATS